MKLRKLLGTFALIAMFALAGTGIGLLATPVNADDAKTAVTIQNVNWDPGWSMVSIATDTDCGVAAPWKDGDTAHVEVKGPTGNTINPAAVVEMNNYIFVRMDAAGSEPEEGTVVTIKAGYSFTDTAEFKEDVSYCYSTKGTSFTPYTPEGTEKAAVTIQNVNWDPNWNMISLATDTDCGVAAPWKDGDTAHVEVKGPTGNTINPAAVVEMNNYIFINVGGEPEEGTVVTIKAGYSFTDTAEFKEDVSYCYSTKGTSFTPYTPEGTEKAAVTVQSVNWSGDWNMILIETDTFCGTSDPWGSGDAAHIQLTGPDGQDIPLDSGKVVELNKHIHLVTGSEPEVGTIVTIKAGYAFTATAEVKEDVSYVYSTKGQPFTVYVPEKDEVKPIDVNWSGDWKMILIGTDTFCGDNDPNDGWGKADPTHVIVKDAIGGTVTPNSVVENDHHIFINIGGEPEIGTIVTIQAGYLFSETAEFKQEYSYIYVAYDQPFEVYDPAKHDVRTFTLTNDPEDNIVRVHATKQLTWEAEPTCTTPHFTSDQPQIASVDANGVVEGLSVGQATITAQAGAIQATYTVEVQPALETKGVEWGISYKIWVEKGAQTVAIPEDFTAHATFEEEGTGNKLVGSDFSVTAENCTLGTVDTNTVGTSSIKATVTYEGTQYQLDLDVEVYEVVPMEIKEVAVVEWFAYNIFIEFPNSSANEANLTNSSLIPDASKFEYTRSDGTVVSAGCYVLGGGNLAVLPSYYSDGVFSSLPEEEKATKYCAAPYMQPGDKLTLKAGLAGYYWTGELAPTPTDNSAIAPHTGMAVRECVLEQDVTYVFDGNLWVVYIPYTDLEVREELTLQMGETKNLGALRVPNDATEGTISYKSANEQIVRVSNTGRVTALEIGETTITVTLSGGVAGEKVKTVKIVVTDGIVKLQFAEGSSLTVKQGTEHLDLSGLTATFLYASGKTETADLTNAEIIGYDMNTVGEIQVTVKVTYNGNTYQDTLTVIVEAAANGGGCGSVIGGTLLGVITVLGAAALVLKKKKD